MAGTLCAASVERALVVELSRGSESDQVTINNAMLKHDQILDKHVVECAPWRCNRLPCLTTMALSQSQREMG